MKPVHLTCPSCGQPISSDQINIQKTLAVCSACHTVFNFGESGAAPNPLRQLGEVVSEWFRDAAPQPIDNDKIKRRKVQQPNTITVNQVGSDLELALKWSWRNWWWLLVIAGFWGAITLYLAVQGLLEGDIIRLLLMLAISIPPLYIITALFRNSTYTRLTHNKLTVNSRPLPWSDHVELDMDEIERFSVEEDAWSDKGDPPSQRDYNLYAHLEDGSKVKVLEDLKRDQAWFMAQELERALTDEAEDAARLVAQDDEDETPVPPDALPRRSVRR